MGTGEMLLLLHKLGCQIQSEIWDDPSSTLTTLQWRGKLRIRVKREKLQWKALWRRGSRLKITNFDEFCESESILIFGPAPDSDCMMVGSHQLWMENKVQTGSCLCYPLGIW